jgi:hypothetical protein
VGSQLVRVNEASLVLPTTLLGIQATDRELPMRRHPRFPISDYTAIFIPRKTSQHPAPSTQHPQHPYHPETRGRRPFAPTFGQCFDQRSLLKDVSWNLDSTIVRKPARASAAMCHREEVFGNPSSVLAVKLQEARPESGETWSVLAAASCG